MDMTGERRIPAPRERVWDALLDPDVLRRAIPGCKTLETHGGERIQSDRRGQGWADRHEFFGRHQAARPGSAGLLPHPGIRPRWPGRIREGGATVTLAEDGAFTLLSYTVNAEVGGKLAQLGGRLIDSSAKQMADQFFDRFTAEVAGPLSSAADGVAGMVDTLVHPAAVPATGHGNAPASISLLAAIPREPLGFPLIAWIGGAAWLVIFAMLFSAYL